MNENIDMRIMEEVSSVIRPWFHIFLSWPPTSFRIWFGVWFIAYAHAFFYIYGWIPSGGSDVPILLCLLDRVGSLVRLVHLSYDIFDVVRKIRNISLFLYAQPCLWELTKELSWIVMVIQQCCKRFFILACTICRVLTWSCSSLD